MAHQITAKFIEALRRLEHEHQVDDIVELFDDESEIGNNTLTDSFHGKNGAREFWTKYRRTFGKINSEFKNEIVDENRAALEWTTSGTGADGVDIEYGGVSVLETDGERITRFFAYFNPNALGQQISGEMAKVKEA